MLFIASYLPKWLNISRKLMKLYFGALYKFSPFQVWRAELILADYVLHMMSSSSVFNGVVAVELGAGTGNVRSLDMFFIMELGC